MKGFITEMLFGFSWGLIFLLLLIDFLWKHSCQLRQDYIDFMKFKKQKKSIDDLFVKLHDEIQAKDEQIELLKQRLNSKHKADDNTALTKEIKELKLRISSIEANRNSINEQLNHLLKLIEIKAPELYEEFVHYSYQFD